MRARDDEVLLSGPAGTGKSRGVLEKLHLQAERYPGCRILVCRKTRASLTHTGLVTFETQVVPLGHPILDGSGRANRGSYVYPNGSEIVTGGLDRITKIMSGEYDTIYVQEAIEATEDDFEQLTTRLRNNVVPYQQIIGDTNPDKPLHWLKRRCDRGQTRMLECRHEDNPTVFDPRTGLMTPHGERYIARLDGLTGARKDRLRYGKWVQAEGVVYEEYDRAVNLVDRFEIPASWDRYLVIDFGFNNPFVAQWWARSPDDQLVRYREMYETGLLVEDAAREVKRLHGDDPRFRRVVCDHDAEDRATFERHTGWRTTAAKKDVSPGIQAVKARLKRRANGRPGTVAMRDSLVRRDPALEEKKKPTCTDEEYDGYVWAVPKNPAAGNAQKKGEEPVKENDHGMDAERYLVAEVDLKPRIDVT